MAAEVAAWAAAVLHFPNDVLRQGAIVTTGVTGERGRQLSNLSGTSSRQPTQAATIDEAVPNTARRSAEGTV